MIVMRDVEMKRIYDDPAGGDGPWVCSSEAIVASKCARDLADYFRLNTITFGFSRQGI